MQQCLQGVTVGSVEDLQAMADAIAANWMTPVVDKSFAFTEAKAAFAHMASGAFRQGGGREAVKTRQQTPPP